MDTPRVIGIDASRAAAAQKTGVERYAFEVIQELKQVVPAEYRVRLYSREPLTGPLAELPPNWENAVLRWPPKRLWTQFRLGWEMVVRPPDMLWVPAHVLPLLLPKRSVVTMHDVAFMPHPEAYTWYGRLYLMADATLATFRAARILTVSEFSKHEIVRWFRVKADRIAVTPLAVRPEEYRRASPEEIAAVRHRHNLPDRFFLYVGRLEKKKNLSGLLLAMREYATVHGDAALPIALVGMPGKGFAAELAAIDGWPSRDRFVRRLGYVDQKDMAALYGGADALVLPSWYEGFGLPVLEAFACGSPVIASKAGSLPEIAGEAAAYVDPAKPHELADALDALAGDDARRAALRQKGAARLPQFSWRRTAEQTWEALRSVVGERAVGTMHVSGTTHASDATRPSDTAREDDAAKSEE